jgi:hypothetical protein
MPYDPNRSAGDEPATSEAATASLEESNPFLQFVDPPKYRELIEQARSSTEGGRLITPLSRLQHRKTGASELNGAWDEELADDAA